MRGRGRVVDGKSQGRGCKDSDRRGYWLQQGACPGGHAHRARGKDPVLLTSRPFGKNDDDNGANEVA